MKICRRPSDLVHAALSEERITSCDEGHTGVRGHGLLCRDEEGSQACGSHGWMRRAVANSLRTIAEALNARGVPTARGGRRQAMTVRNLLARA